MFEDKEDRDLDKIVVRRLSALSKELDDQIGYTTDLHRHSREITIKNKSQESVFELLSSESNKNFSFKNDGNTESIFKCLTNLQKMMISEENEKHGKSESFISIDHFFNHLKNEKKEIGKIGNYEEAEVKNLLQRTELENQAKNALDTMEERFMVANFLLETGEEENEITKYTIDTFPFYENQFNNKSQSNDLDDSKNSSRLLDELSLFSIPKSDL